MIRIPDISFIRDSDLYTINNEPISSVDLMERAADALCRRLLSKLLPEQKVIVFAGPGNNGGDGLVIARLLLQQGYDVEVFALPAKDYSADFTINLHRLEAFGIKVKFTESENELPATLSPDCIVVDALFGSGLNKAVGGFAAKLIDFINEQKAVVVSVDIPSGLFADTYTDPGSAIVKADYTFTFEWPKRAFFIPENEFFVGSWELVPIGLHADRHREQVSFGLLTFDDIRPMLRNRPKFSHKGSFGHALLLAGSADKTGAAVLAAKACLRSGAGLVHVHIPQKAVVAMQSQLPEVMISRDHNDNIISELPELSTYDAIGMGPGIGQEIETANVLKLLIQEAIVPLVLDADALNILSENKTWIAFLPKNSIITPHPKEFERLAGKSLNGFDRLEMQRQFAVRHGLIVVLKGAYTSIAFPDGTAFLNPGGNPGMATAGSGDVLTGIILSLLAQHYSPYEAALTAVFLHGLAGDLALDAESVESLIASDIVANLGRAFKRLQS